MSIHPILFKTEMVLALLDGRKTVTRRVVKPQPEGNPVPMGPDSCWPGCFVIQGTERVIRPLYKPGDILWVLETWSTSERSYLYRAWPGAGMEPEKQDQAMREMGLKWRSPYHMPWAAARIFLRVADVRAERLQAMSHEDAEQEGCWCGEGGLAMPLDKFAEVWDSTIKPADRPTYGWAANPWVWVIEFERISREEINHETRC